MKAVLVLIAALLAPPALAAEYLIYGGGAERQFLGCIGCDAFDEQSICNAAGMGSSTLATSIFNPRGRYGSARSRDSVWHPTSTGGAVPVLVDRAGKVHGVLTINSARQDAVAFAENLKRTYELARGDLDRVRTMLCDTI